MKLVFFGTPDFAVPSLLAVKERHTVLAVVTQPDSPAGRGGSLRAPPVKRVAEGLGIPVLAPEKLRQNHFIEDLAALKPDLAVVVAYGKILPKDLLAIPPLGCWNVHASLLPKYRGAAPIQWSLVRGEKETGVSIMKLDEGMDTGPVATQWVEPITPDDTAETLAVRLAARGAACLQETLARIAEGTVTLHDQDASQATYAPLIKKEDGLLDFRKTAWQVHAHARGMEPWPGAWTSSPKGSLRVFLSSVQPGQGAPGQVLGLIAEGLRVACGEGAIAFQELQLPGKKRIPAQAFLAGNPLPAGTILGSQSPKQTAP